jgi:hypothetical protein
MQIKFCKKLAVAALMYFSEMLTLTENKGNEMNLQRPLLPNREDYDDDDL